MLSLEKSSCLSLNTGVWATKRRRLQFSHQESSTLPLHSGLQRSTPRFCLHKHKKRWIAGGFRGKEKKNKKKTMCRADFQSTLHALCMKPCTGSRSEQQAQPRCAAPRVFGRCLLALMSGLINTLLVTNAGRRTQGRAPPGLSVLWVGTAVACGFDTKLCLPKEQADSTSFNFIELKSHC